MAEPPAPVAPSGDQHEIVHGDQRAVIVEVGGGLRTYEVAGTAVLDGYALHERCASGRGQLLIPWPNRTRDGRYEFDGERQQLPLTEPAGHNAIHGLVRWANWTVAERNVDRIVMEHRLHPQPGWPGTLGLRVAYALGPGGLSVTTTATNLGSADCPYGAGAHPYLTLGSDSIDLLTLRIPAHRYLASDERGIPTVARDVAGTPLDFGEPRVIGDLRLDTAYTDLERDPDGRARVRIATADGTRRAQLWVDGAYTFLMVFTGDTLPAAGRRRGLAVEPMSCAPNALQSGDGLIRLEPGAGHTGVWGIAPG